MVKLSLITATYNRPEKLKNICLPSLLSQHYQNFEWIVVNDGSNRDTREIVCSLKSDFEIKYIETSHIGFCNARNLGLEQSSGELLGFLDDDNYIYASYVKTMLQHFESDPTISMAMPIQDRRRDVYHDGKLIRRGKDFIGPRLDATNRDFVMGNAMFDSNGFIHKRNKSTKFNENLLILADYEYLLRCFSEFGLGAFSLCHKHLIEYIQTTEGIIGKSSWADWLSELNYIWENRSDYKIFSVVEPDLWLPEKITELKQKVTKKEKLPGFSA